MCMTSVVSSTQRNDNITLNLLEPELRDVFYITATCITIIFSRWFDDDDGGKYMRTNMVLRITSNYPRSRWLLS